MARTIGCRRGIKAVSPERLDQQANRNPRGPAGGRPPAFYDGSYKGRNVVEWSFNLLQRWRGLATRFDKPAIVHLSAAVLAAVLTWAQI